jgi:hypothetical protein
LEERHMLGKPELSDIARLYADLVREHGTKGVANRLGVDADAVASEAETIVSASLSVGVRRALVEILTGKDPDEPAEMIGKAMLVSTEAALMYGIIVGQHIRANGSKAPDPGPMTFEEGR